jgi:uncharacterized protein YjiS (DUF1127 family)
MGRICAVDDDRLLRGTVERALQSECREVASARGDRDGLMLLDLEGGAATKPHGGQRARTADGSIGHSIRRAAIAMGRLIGGPLERLAIFIPAWLDQAAERRRLRSLSDHMLKDIGVSRCDVERAARERARP